MKRYMILLLSFVLCMPVYAKEEPKELYAQSAVLMDAESGRVLFSKNGTDVRAMASTTKIMTCILALENDVLDKVITFSNEAVRQPKVHLGAAAGESFYVRDLIYSLMLESHNDTAVAVAEAVSGDVKSFAQLMNQKAKEIGCTDTYFITPNGLDATDESGTHSTTAVDLAKIMSYCVLKSPKREAFLAITQTPQHTFSDTDGKRTYSCSNHNSFLGMMSEAISGKTGFTSDAGYCYVGAIESDGRTFVVALLACGWPNNKTYKWKDMRKLSEYGLESYHYQALEAFPNTVSIAVYNGVPGSEELFDEVYVDTLVDGKINENILLHKEEKIEINVTQEDIVEAPVKKGQQVGEVIYSLNGEIIAIYPIITQSDVRQKDYAWSLKKIWEMYVMK